MRKGKIGEINTENIGTLMRTPEEQVKYMSAFVEEQDASDKIKEEIKQEIKDVE